MLSTLQSKSASSQQFFKAVEQNGTSELIDLVLSTHCDPRYIRNKKQQTLLHVACQLNCSGVIDMVRVLVEIYQCDPFVIDQNSLTAYHYSCLSGNLEVFSYLLRISDHHFIINYQPPPQSLEILAQSHFYKLITAANQSGSIEMLRYVYHHKQHECDKFSLKLSLFKDQFAMICKTVDCYVCKVGMLHSIHSSWSIHTDLYEACCAGNLDAVKFFLDELKIHEHHFYSGTSLKFKGQEKQVYASLLEVAYRLNNYEIVQYLTTSKGIGPVQITSNIQYRNVDIDTTHKYGRYDHHLDTCSPVHMAVRSGNMQAVKELVSQGHNLYGDTDTLLHSACVSGKREMVSLLIDKFGCRINTYNNIVDKDTPLHVACEWGHLDICLLLLELEGCDIDATNARGHTPLSLAVRHNRYEIFRTLLTKGANIHVKTKDTSETPLHFACCYLSSRFALALFANKNYTLEELNVSDKYGDTALFNACRTGNVELVKILVSKFECVRTFVNKVTNEMPIHVACRMNSLEIFKALASEGVDSPVQCHQLNYLKKSLLHLACENDAENIVDYLIDNKVCELNNLDNNGRSPLHIACMRGNVKIVKKLLASGKFEITDKDKEENTVLHYICTRDIVDAELIMLCLNNGNSSMIIEQNSFKYNPLHYLFANDGVQILKCLLEQLIGHKLVNIALCMPSEDECTPLHLAFKERRFMVIKYIFSCFEISDGLSNAFCVQNAEMNNAFHYAIKYCKDFPLLDANGRPISGSFAVAVIDLLFNSKVHEQDVVKSLCQKNNSQHTPIQYLISKVWGDKHSIELSILSRLLNSSKLSPKSKQKIFSVSNDGNTLIHLAVDKSCFGIVKFLVEQKICTFTTCNKSKESPLHIACGSSQKPEMSLWLCEHGYDPYQLDESGCSPLFNAIKSCQSLHKLLVQTVHWKPEAPILRVHVDSEYIHRYERIMIDSESISKPIELPLPHCLLLHCNYNLYDMEFVIKLPNVRDSLGNTLLHLCSVHFFAHNNNQCLPKILLDLEVCDVNLKNIEGNTPLHIACATQNQSMVAFLLESDKCSESLTIRNANGHTPLYYVADRDLINCLIMNGADPKDVAESARVQHINEAFKKVKHDHPLDPTVTALILGNSLAGKTTLIKTLTKAYNWKQLDMPSIGQLESVHKEERTTGVEISEYKVHDKHIPRVLFYDFAGQTQSFQSTQSILLQNLLSRSHLSPVLFVIVIDVTLSKHDRLNQLSYWANFIESCQPLHMAGEIEVIIIGSHIDKIHDEDEKKSLKTSLTKAMQPFESDTFKLIENSFLLDCRESSASELVRVKGILLRSVNQLKEYAELDNRCHLIFSYLYERFPDKPVRFSELHGSLRKRKPDGFSTNESILPLMTNKLISLLENMQSRQHILLVGHTAEGVNRKSDFWILTAKAQNLMFKHVHGLLFAKEEDFENHVDIESNVGVLSSTELIKAFPDIDYEMLQEFLEYSELCKKICDKAVLKLIKCGTTEPENITSIDDESLDDQQTISASNFDDLQTIDGNNKSDVEYFFFPGLVKETRKYVFQNKKYRYSSGWTLECIKGDHFKSIFLQVLLLRLTFQFAASRELDKKLYRECIIWKNGLSWSKSGVEVYVEVTNQNQKVFVILRCLDGAELTAIQLRSAVIKEVYAVKAKYGGRTKTTEFIIYNPQLNGDESLTELTQKVTIKELASAVTTGPSSPFIQDTSCHTHHINKDLLCFEPYSGIDSNLMTTLFDSSKANETVPEETSARISTMLKNAGAQSQHIDHIMQLVSTSIVYQNLRDLLDKYSIFHGRNPKVS